MGFWSKHPGRHQEDLSQKVNKYKFLLLFISFVLFVIVLVSSGLVLTEKPFFCSLCHEMTPEIQTWKATAHHNVGCVNCHRAPGFASMISYKSTLAKDVVMHFTGYKLPITIQEPIKDEYCESCHSGNRLYTPSGDIIIPHAKHKSRGIPCISCHAGVAHGKIAQRQVTGEGNLAAWTLATGKKETTLTYTKPSMSTCMDCHFEKKVTTDCKACHTTITLPASHEDPQWVPYGKHGLAARKSLQSCHNCHSFSQVKVVTGTKDKIAQYARTNSYCFNCHLTRPLGHGDNWLSLHKKDVLTKGRANCLVCHNEDKGPFDEKVSGVYCNKCHANGVHNSDWRRQHPNFVKNEGITKGRCFECHDNRQCTGCHTNPAIKPF